MTWTLTSDVEDYLGAAGDFLRERPAANSVPLTVAEMMRARGAGAFGEEPPVFGWWSASGVGLEGVAGAVSWTPPYPVLLTAMPAGAAGALAAELRARGRRVPLVDGAEEAAVEFAAAWGTSASVHRRTRLHRLAELVPPDPLPPGSARVAGAEDRTRLVEWYEAFQVEIHDASHGVEGQVDDRLAYGGLTLWELPGGEVVSMAGVSRQIVGATRVAPVYTPPELRGRGYAAAVTAAVTQGALAAGAEEVLLFTDLANPTSNRLYERLGYRGVEDRVTLALSD